MPIPLSALSGLGNPEAAERLREQFGGRREVDRDGSVYTSINTRPIPPPKALRLIHAHRQEEKKQREEDQEAEEFERQHGMGVKESHTTFNPAERDLEALRRKRELAQRALESRLCDAACTHEVFGCGLTECDGVFQYSESFCHGAPVYVNERGWTLHRDRPPVLETVGSDQEQTEFGWILSKDRKPFYAVKTEELIIPSSGWQCFYGPPPPPSQVSATSFEEHFSQQSGRLKELGNDRLKTGAAEDAEVLYTEGINSFEGFDEVIASSEKLQQLVTALRANRAEARLRCRKPRDAQEDCLWVLNRDPNHAKAANRLARACREDPTCGPSSVEALQLALSRGATPSASSSAAASREEIRLALEDVEMMVQCESGSSQLTGLYHKAQQLREALQRLRDLGPGHQEVTSAGESLTKALKEREAKIQPKELKEVVLLRSLGLADMVLEAFQHKEETAWTGDLLSLLLGLEISDTLLRKVLSALPPAALGLVQSPGTALLLAGRLLRHRSGVKHRVADTIVEARGLLAGCLRLWIELLEHDTEEAEAVTEVLLALDSQVTRQDNLEALALALFVETFVGERRAGVVTGGAVMKAGPSVRRLVLGLLRRWTGDEKVLRSFSPELIGRMWASMRGKLRRDADIETLKELPKTSNGHVLKLEWYKLKPSSALRKGVGAFHPEELLEASLAFLKAHFDVTCRRGPGQPQEGLLGRDPAEEWCEDVLDKPFGWGVLLPLVVAPATVASSALLLLEALQLKHPHNEHISNRLAGLHTFLPLLKIPTPPEKPATSHLGSTLSLSSTARRAAAVLLQCSLDTTLGMKVVKDLLEESLEAVWELLEGALPDECPETIAALSETLGMICGNFRCIDQLPPAAIPALLRELLRSSSASIRSHLAKLLRLVHTDPVGNKLLAESLEDARLGLDESQRARVWQEIFDPRTPAGQLQAQKLAEQQVAEERVPLDAAQVGHAPAVASALAQTYLSRRPSNRVLLMGRVARALARSLVSCCPTCQVVLAETAEITEPLDKVVSVRLPSPQGVASDPVLTQTFDFVILAEPMGFLDVAEYAECLRPFIRRREHEEEKVKDQVQLVCLELRERLEDACDELYSAGYYSAEHDQDLPKLRRASFPGGWGVALLSLPSAEKERRKKEADHAAKARKVQRELEEEANANRNEEEQLQRLELHSQLFCAESSAEVQPLPISFEVGARSDEAQVLVFWLHGPREDPTLWKPVLEEVVEKVGRSAVRVVGATLPSGQTSWFDLSDSAAVNLGLEWYELAEGPTQEAAEKAAKDPAVNVSFGKPTLQELKHLATLEVSVRGLLALAEKECIASPACSVVFGGFSLGGSVAAYAGLSGLASDEVAKRLTGVVLCCSGVPVFHFLASKMQANCLQRRETLQQSAWNGDVPELPPLPTIHLVYGEKDPEVRNEWLETIRGLCQRFNFPTATRRFRGSKEDRFPAEARSQGLTEVLKLICKAESGLKDFIE